MELFRVDQRPYYSTIIIEVLSRCSGTFVDFHAASFAWSLLKITGSHDKIIAILGKVNFLILQTTDAFQNILSWVLIWSSFTHIGLTFQTLRNYLDFSENDESFEKNCELALYFSKKQISLRGKSPYKILHKSWLRQYKKKMGKEKKSKILSLFLRRSWTLLRID